jgi:membrane-associated phospholipid phosphatase
MDNIVSLDWGVYYHFDLAGQRDPALFDFMQPARHLGSYAGTAVFLAAAILLFLVRGRIRSAIVATSSMALAVLLIECVQFLVPRRRPTNAQNWLGEGATSGSYPSSDVFLFTLAMILLGMAIWGFKPRAVWRALFLAVAAALTVWVSLSQFVLPLHFFSDVLGGLAGAACVGWTAYMFMKQPTAPRQEPALAAPADAIQDMARTHGIQG